jgi:hypothetical protein
MYAFGLTTTPRRPQVVDSAPATKVKRTVSVDPDIIDQLVGTANLSALVNELLHAEAARRERRRALEGLLGELEDVVGPPDETLVAHYADQLR